MELPGTYKAAGLSRPSIGVTMHRQYSHIRDGRRIKTNGVSEGGCALPPCRETARGNVAGSPRRLHSHQMPGLYIRPSSRASTELRWSITKSDCLSESGGRERARGKPRDWKIESRLSSAWLIRTRGVGSAAEKQSDRSSPGEETFTKNWRAVDEPH